MSSRRSTSSATPRPSSNRAGLQRLSQAVLLVALLCLGLGCTAHVVPLPPGKLRVSARSAGRPSDGGLERVRVADDGRSFVLDPSRQPWRVWGLNYDHDDSADERLLEDYWDREWPTVVADFHEMKALGANVVRIHLQLGRFLDSPSALDHRALGNLRRLVGLAEQTGLYLDLTGLANYRPRDVPSWYDSLDERERWAAQARFWGAVAELCSENNAIFAYNLMNEPAMPAEPQPQWLGAPFVNGRTYVELLTRDPKGRQRAEVARAWLRTMSSAIRRYDDRHLITVGLFIVGDQAENLAVGMTPTELKSEIDFFSVHLYPKEGELDHAMAILRSLSVGKPIVLEETAPLRCTVPTLRHFLVASRPDTGGWMGFYWGRTLDEYRKDPTPRAELMVGWLSLFQEMAQHP